jgi:DNA-binding transcriptional ArsR family regulator
VRALLALRHGELCVCQITALLALAPSTVSKHMSVLRQAGLVLGRKHERWMHYRLPGRDASLPLRRMVAVFTDCLASSDEVKRDDMRLKSIRTMNAEQLCRPRRASSR